MGYLGNMLSEVQHLLSGAHYMLQNSIQYLQNLIHLGYFNHIFRLSQLHQCH